ncbi:aspartate kinase [Fodinibius salinus]|uniref:Aspartate kinase n=1 Tax=Fodinibius salinus TaxID=860790 RepID=A0A5D3YIR9_9BACT|nr:aspartate kinase [Fodinibius salinus]TYP92204.1 aspartate kinase [Fodinibius salinus]
MSSDSKHILKFGGTSLQDQKFIKQSAKIVTDRLQTAQPFVVVSALGGVTDTLISLADQIETNTDTTEKKINELRKKHLGIFDQLADSDHQNREKLTALFDELHDILDGVGIQSVPMKARKDHILSIGERASALIFASALSQQGISGQAFEAHQFIKTDSTFGEANVKLDASRKLIRQYLLQHPQIIPVITGFIGSDEQQRITTLGRSGSDYTAGLVANALEAEHLEIWTDVNGVLSADPKWVPTAQSIDELNFADIAELSAHGAEVIHHQTIQPIRHQNISVRVKNSYNPTHPGTAITPDFNSNGSLKTITLTGPFVRLQIDEQHSLDLLSNLKQWSTGDSLPASIQRTSEFEPARFLLEQSFFERFSDKLANWASDRGIILDLQSELYEVKKFSNYFTDDKSLTKRIWNILDANKLQPVTSSRNRDERFISFLFNKEDAQRAARLLNDYLQDDQTVIDLFVAGTGAVGQTLLKQLKNLEPEGITFRLLGTCNSRKALWDDQGIDLDKTISWSQGQPTNWDQLTEKLTQPHLHNVIFVDATGSEEVARLYPQLMESGAHIVTPSKLANTFEQSFFDKLQSLTESQNTSFRYETTVGAGLPVISTVKDLQASGDTITEISGVVSGTMTYLFNQLEQGVPFSDAVADARKKGYAEPDPRDDLSGEDVARKFLTLARTLGLKIDRNQLTVESLIPNELTNVDKNTFLEKLSDCDGEWEERIRKAQNKNEVLRYTGRLKDGNISIGIESVSQSSPIGQLNGTNNLIQIFTHRYHQSPLVIQGPGAGKEVTAAGVLADILKTAKKLSH